MTDFLSETGKPEEVAQSWKCWEKKNGQPQLLSLTKLFFKNEGEIYSQIKET